MRATSGFGRETEIDEVMGAVVPLASSAADVSCVVASVSLSFAT